MIKIGLCDDNKSYIKQLTSILIQISENNNLKFEFNTFNSGEDLIDFCSRHKNYFDIIFLDILMERKNGIDTAKFIRDLNCNSHIIFVTVSKDYALDSYDVNASGYILKPFSYDSIENAVLNLHNKIILSRKNSIFVKNNQDLYTLQLDEVIYFESNLRKITAFLINGDEITFYNKISSLEIEFQCSTFVRCHRSFLVNLTYVKNIVASDLETTTGSILPISKKYLSSLRDEFTKYIKFKI